MPSELMDQRRMSALYAPSVALSDEIRMPAQNRAGFWKADSMFGHHGTEGLPSLFGTKYPTSQPLEKSHSIHRSSVENFPSHQDLYGEKLKAKYGQEYSVEAGRTIGFSTTSWKANVNDLDSRSNLFIQPGSLNLRTNKFNPNGIPHENGLLASSLPDLLRKKLTLSSSDLLYDQSTDKVGSLVEDELFNSLEAKEIEARTIGNLLPDDEDLLSGVIDELECIPRRNYWNDAEDDLFSSGGGMELETDSERLNYGKHSNLLNGVSKIKNWGLENSNGWEKSYSADPSRTLFVGNIPSTIDDAELRLLFEQYGDTRTVYTACKNRGFVKVTYCDLRAACDAMRALQNKLLWNKKLDVHFSITKDNLLDKELSQGVLSVFNVDPSISNEDLHNIFVTYGEIKQIREHQSYRLIEFYDIRAAEAALQALNMSDVAGKQIEIVANVPSAFRHSAMQPVPSELENIEGNGCHQQGNLPTDSPSRCTSISAGVVLGNNFRSRTNQGLHSVSRHSINSLRENVHEGYNHGSSHYLSSSSGFGEHSHSMGQMNMGFDSEQFHAHSLPDHPEALLNGISYASPNTMSAMAINIARHAEGADNIHASRGSSAGLSNMSFGCNERAFGALGNGSSTHHGRSHQYGWNDLSSSHQKLQSPALWQDSAFLNGIPTHSPSQLPGLSRAHSHLLNNVVPLHQHHVGSAPTLNPSIWDRRHMYPGDLSEASAFHPSSVESLGFSGSSGLHPMELGSPNIFPRVRGNFVEPLIGSPQIGLPSPQQKFHMFHGRNSVISMPSTYDSPSDRVRSRRGDTNSNQSDNKRQYELDIDRIIRGEDNRTTLMIKNIPNKYTSKMLLAAIDENHRGTYDFIYLPIDFKNKCNVGYAFINMIDPQQIVPFYKTFNGKKWEKFNSEKVASLAYARIQGRSALIAHFQNSSLMNEDKRCRPILFHADGPNAGDQEPFPMGTNIRSRPGRSKAYSGEDNPQGSPSNSTDGEDSSSGLDSSGSKKE